MARYLRTILQPLTALVAGTNPDPIDLPVNPLSFILLRLQQTRTDPAVLGTYSAMDDLIDDITRVRVLHLGEQIISGSLRDLMVVNMAMLKAMPGWSVIQSANNSLSNAVFPLLLGKRMYDPVSCFPPTRRGNLRFEMEIAAAFTGGHDAVSFALETVELIEAEPSEHVKYVEQARTSVVGQFDAPLPIGNALLGILLFDTAIAEENDGTTSWGQVRLLMDNVEQWVASAQAQTLAGELHSSMRGIPMWPGHTHLYDGTQGAGTEGDEAQIAAVKGYQGYFHLDFDPLGDNGYEVPTVGRSDVIIRGVGTAADPVRYFPLERKILAAMGP